MENLWGTFQYLYISVNLGAWTKNASFTVSLSQARTVAVSVKYATANGTAVAPADYTAKAPTALPFSAGQTSKTITVPVKGDLAGEADETFSVVLSGATNIAIGDGTGTGTITDNDPPVPHVSVGDISLTEGNSAKNAVFTVSLTNAAKAAVSVKYATANGTAVAPSDYTAKALTALSFSAGQTSKTVSVALKADGFGEGDETFSLNLSGPVGVVIDDGQATATIVNDDAPAPEVSVADVSITEGSSALSSKNLIFTVQLSAPAQGAVSLKYKTANGTAVAPSDFTAKALTALSFSKGQTSKTVSIPIKGDTVDEADESFQLQLSDASAGLTIVDGLATGTIVDDD
jgi:chitinase